VRFLCVYLLTWYKRHSDQAGERFGHIATSLLVGISGFLAAMTTMNTAVRYLSM
jgi:hypothetical protein